MTTTSVNTSKSVNLNQAVEAAKARSEFDKFKKQDSYKVKVQDDKGKEYEIVYFF